MPLCICWTSNCDENSSLNLFEQRCSGNKRRCASVSMEIPQTTPAERRWRGRQRWRRGRWRTVVKMTLKTKAPAIWWVGQVVIYSLNKGGMWASGFLLSAPHRIHQCVHVWETDSHFTDVFLMKWNPRIPGGNTAVWKIWGKSNIASSWQTASCAKRLRFKRRRENSNGQGVVCSALRQAKRSIWWALSWWLVFSLLCLFNVQTYLRKSNQFKSNVNHTKTQRKWCDRVHCLSETCSSLLIYSFRERQLHKQWVPPPFLPSW